MERVLATAVLTCGWVGEAQADGDPRRADPDSGSLCVTKRYAGTYIYPRARRTGSAAPDSRGLSSSRIRSARSTSSHRGRVITHPAVPGVQDVGVAHALGGDLGAGVAGADHHEGGASGTFARTQPRTTRLTQNTGHEGVHPSAPRKLPCASNPTQKTPSLGRPARRAGVASLHLGGGCASRGQIMTRDAGWAEAASQTCVTR